MFTSVLIAVIDYIISLPVLQRSLIYACVSIECMNDIERVSHMLNFKALCLDWPYTLTCSLSIIL